MTSPDPELDVDPEPTLSEWLLEQLAEDERVAREAGGGGKRPGAGSWNRECGHRDFDDELLPPGHGSCCVVDGDIRIYDEGGHDPEQADHIARHDPARVLAEVAAKRQLVELHCPSRNYIDEMCSHTPADGEILVCASCGDQGRDENEVVAPCPTLRLLALPYAGRPGYREQWAP